MITNVFDTLSSVGVGVGVGVAVGVGVGVGVGVVLALLTLKETPRDAPTLPAVSVAQATTLCAPLLTAVEFHVTSYGPVVSVATSAPSTYHLTFARLLPLSEAVAASRTAGPDTAASASGAVMTAFGLERSARAAPPTPAVASSATHADASTRSHLRGE